MVFQYQMVSLENKIQSGIIQTEPVIIRNIYVYTYLYVATINEKKKRGHEFEREKRVVVYRRCWREEREK